MGTRLKYDSTRLGVGLLLFFILYFVILPANWPAPSVRTEVPSAAAYGRDVGVTVTVRAWHPNFSVRQVSLALDSVNSTAVAGNIPFVPVNLHEQERVESWSIGLKNRLSRPVRRRLDLRLPLGQLSGKRIAGPGKLQGSIDLVIDHTRVTMKAGYPPLVLRESLPFALRLD